MWPPEQQRTLHRQRRQDFACLALDAKLGFLVVSLLRTPYSWDAKQRSRRRRSPAGCHRVRPGAVLPQECGPDAPRPSSPWLPVCPRYERGGGLGLLPVSLGKEDRDGQVVFSQDAPKRWTLFLLRFPGETHGPMQVPGLP